jgi:hypothetical protein
MTAHSDKSLRECLDKAPPSGKATYTQTEARERAQRRNFALMQLTAMRTTVSHHVAPFVETWHTNELLLKIDSAMDHLRKEIENGKAKKQQPKG